MARFTIVSTPAIVRFAAPTTAAPRMSGSAAQVARTASKAARKPLMIALPVQCTPPTTSRQAAENQGAIASIAGLQHAHEPVARGLPDRERDVAEADRRLRGGVDRRAACRRSPRVPARTAAVTSGKRVTTPPIMRAVSRERAAHAALLAAVDLRDLRALLDEHHQRVHARGERDEDVVELEHQHPALEGRGARGAAHRLQRGAAALDRRDARERRLALAADRRLHLVGRERADGDAPGGCRRARPCRRGSRRRAGCAARAGRRARRRRRRCPRRCGASAAPRRSPGRCARRACRWSRPPRAGGRRPGAARAASASSWPSAAPAEPPTSSRPRLAGAAAPEMVASARLPFAADGDELGLQPVAADGGQAHGHPLLGHRSSPCGR